MNLRPCVNIFVGLFLWSMKNIFTAIIALVVALGVTSVSLNAGTCGGCSGSKTKETSKEKDKSASSETESKDKPAKS